MRQYIQAAKLFARFWIETFKEAFGKGWAASGVVSALIPDLIVVLGKMPVLRQEQVALIHWVSQNQNLARLYCVAGVFLIYLAYAPYRKCKEVRKETFDKMLSAYKRLQKVGEERDKLEAQIAELKRPHLMVSYEDACPECRFPTQHSDGIKGVVARLRVESARESGVSECRAEITLIEKDGVTVMSGGHLPLSFAPASHSDARSKTINHKHVEHLEVLWIPREGKSRILVESFPFAFYKLERLEKGAHYSFHIALFGHKTVATAVILDARERYDGAWMLLLREPAAPPLIATTS